MSQSSETGLETTQRRERSSARRIRKTAPRSRHPIRSVRESHIGDRAAGYVDGHRGNPAVSAANRTNVAERTPRTIGGNGRPSNDGAPRQNPGDDRRGERDGHTAHQPCTRAVSRHRGLSGRTEPQVAYHASFLRTVQENTPYGAGALAPGRGRALRQHHGCGAGRGLRSSRAPGRVGFRRGDQAPDGAFHPVHEPARGVLGPAPGPGRAIRVSRPRAQSLLAARLLADREPALQPGTHRGG